MPSPSTALVPAQSKSRRLAAKACWAACVRMADQREKREASTAWRRMSGAALALVWASKRGKVVVSWAPPASDLEGKNHESTSSGAKKLRVCPFFGSACVLGCCSRVLSGSSARLAGGG